MLTGAAGTFVDVCIEIRSNVNYNDSHANGKGLADGYQLQKIRLDGEMLRGRGEPRSYLFAAVKRSLFLWQNGPLEVSTSSWSIVGQLPQRM